MLYVMLMISSDDLKSIKFSIGQPGLNAARLLTDEHKVPAALLALAVCSV